MQTGSESLREEFVAGEFVAGEFVAGEFVAGEFVAGEFVAGEFVQSFAEWCAAIVELLGVGVITVLVGYSLLYGIAQLLRRVHGRIVFREMRARLVSGILIGLDLLVAADIIHTVAVELTYTSIGVLVVIVLVRTFLSFTLELELTGHWPWQHKPEETPEECHVAE